MKVVQIILLAKCEMCGKKESYYQGVDDLPVGWFYVWQSPLEDGAVYCSSHCVVKALSGERDAVEVVSKETE